MPVTLEQLLQSRDNRAKHQKDLLDSHPGRSLLCMTVQLPGPEKRNKYSLAIAQAGVEAIRKAFSLEYEELKDLETGYEGFFLVPLPAEEAKRLACRIEDTHPLGRLMDIDVLFADAQAGEKCFSPALSLSRGDIGLEPRRCLLCGNEVRYCMRAKTHTTAELLARIEEMVKVCCDF